MDERRFSITKADIVAAFIAKQEVPAVFMLSGGMIAFLIDSVAQLGITPIINTRHEQSAGFAAEGATRVAGRSAVAMGTSGPGATNLLTAVASSFFDSIPTVFITGQVNQSEFKKSEKQRQNGFQELNIVKMAAGITKYTVEINSDSDLEAELRKCWAMAHEGRPGPVLLDIPIDVQQEVITVEESSFSKVGANGKTVETVETDLQIMELVKSIQACERPLFLLGGGIRASHATTLIRELVTKWRIPAVFSLMGVDVLESSSPFRIGMIGSYGNRWANRALANADLVIALGTRLDVRQTGSDLANFTNGKKIFRVDIDPSELEGRIRAEISVQADLQSFLHAALKVLPEFSFSSWLNEIREEELKFPQEFEQTEVLELNPNELMKWISSISTNINGYCIDVGQHQMWSAQSLQISTNQRFLTSGGLGAMGFALPSAIGAAIAKPGRWVVISGDGSTQLSIAELETISHYNLPITICIINNNQHGMVAQFQEENMDGRYIGTRVGYSAPDFSSVAKSYGIQAIRIENTVDLRSAAAAFSNLSAGPLVLEFVISANAKALPKMSSGNSIQDL